MVRLPATDFMHSCVYDNTYVSAKRNDVFLYVNIRILKLWMSVKELVNHSKCLK